MFGKTNSQELVKAMRSLASESNIELSSVTEATEEAILWCLSLVYGAAKFKAKVDPDSGRIEILKGYRVSGKEEAEASEGSEIDQIPQLEGILNRGTDNDLEHSSQNQSEESPRLAGFGSFAEWINSSKNPQPEVNQDQEEFEEEIEPYFEPISESEANIYQLDSKPGDEIFVQSNDSWDRLFDKNNILVTKFSKFLTSKIAGLVKEREFLALEKKKGTCITAIVKRRENGYVLAHEGMELFLPAYGLRVLNRRDDGRRRGRNYGTEIIPGDEFNLGDRIQVYVKAVNRSNYDYQAICSRSDPAFLEWLFWNTIPEIRDEKIVIKDVVREAGVRAKVALYSTNPDINPVGACVGVRGSRLEIIKKEVRNEKIDLINYSGDMLTYLNNALGGIRPTRIIVDEENQQLFLTISDRDLSAVIGRGGSNVRLLSKLLRIRVKVLSHDEERAGRAKQIEEIVAHFNEILDVDETISKLLVLSKYESLESIISCPVSTLASIEGFDEELATEIQSRAQTYLESKIADERREIALENEEKEKFSTAFSVLGDRSEVVRAVLLENSVLNIEQLADLDSEELGEILEGYFDPPLEDDELDCVILAARRAAKRID